MKTALLWGVGVIVVAAAACFCGLPGDGLDSSTVPQNCTVFVGADEDRVLVGNNEDQGNPVVNVWFLPASESAYGRFLIGTEGIVQGGMNEHGLVYDSLSKPWVEVAADERPLHYGMWPLHVLETCRTIEEAIAFFEQHNFPGVWGNGAFFADATGDAAVFEGVAIARKSGPFFVATNFQQTEAEPHGITCERFLTATSMLEDAEAYTPELFREILDSVHAEYHDGGGTVYSTLYDLHELTITCYLYYDYEHPVLFDLREEMRRSEQAFELRTVLPPSAAYESWRAGKIGNLAREIASLRTEGADPAPSADVIGHYAVAGGEPFVHAPLITDSFSVARVGDRLAFVACPEGVALELFPLGGDLFRIAGMNPEADFDVALARDASGGVSGATLSVCALGVDIALDKVSDVPVFDPLPGFMVPFPDSGGETSEPASDVSRIFWVGVGLAVLGLLGAALLLLLP